MYNNM